MRAPPRRSSCGSGTTVTLRKYLAYDGRQARLRIRRRRRVALAAIMALGALVAVLMTGVLKHPAPLNAVSPGPKTRASRQSSDGAEAHFVAGTTLRRARDAGRGPLSTDGKSRQVAARNSWMRASAPDGAGCSMDLSAATHTAEAEHTAGYRIGFALVTSSGHSLTAFTPATPNYGASITKAMLLVAFLSDRASEGLSAVDREELSEMIEGSDNNAANWVYQHLRSPTADVRRVASEAGMTGFHLDLSDPVYVLGQSLVTAGDFARFFSVIEAFMRPRYRNFGMRLLAGVNERVGLLAAHLPGVVYSKEGWKPENVGTLGAPYIVNQAGQFSCGGVTYGVAVTVGRAADQETAESVVQRIVSALAPSRRR
jgi:hypothetical protein